MEDLDLTEKVEFEVRLEKTDERIKPQELSNFLYYYKSLYSGLQNQDNLLQEFKDGYSNNNIEEIISEFQTYRDERIQTISVHLEDSSSYTSDFFWDDTQEPQLEVSKIQKSSPLTFTVVGLGFLVVIVTSICGGKGDISIDTPLISGEASFRLDKNLGEGIEDLKKAFYYDPEENEDDDNEDDDNDE